ncbi:MAG: RnfABCDGE type electron transport complex subunit B [Gammaproteobacteria bacterium]|nr:RnfABCDGE type electron transport complex subunit B [Gammaproteobacteria bacterium]
MGKVLKSADDPEQLIHAIDQILPQTQCGLCGFGGCLPYAQAIVLEKACLNLCPPGGIETLKALGSLLAQPIDAYIPDMETKQKPPLQAVIREEECIGCTKCISACPVDAILGSGKQMHTVIADLCTGCELCIPPCPVDCIDMITVPLPSPSIKLEKANYARELFNMRNQRLERQIMEKDAELSPKPIVPNRKDYILAALQRKKMK